MERKLPDRRAWLLAIGILVVGAVIPVFGLVAILPGVILLAVVAGRTAAWGLDAPRGNLVCAWAVPTLATLLAIAPVVLFFVTLGDIHEPLGIILLAMGFGVLAGLVWLVFGIAVLVEAQHRRRFGSAHLRVGG